MLAIDWPPNEDYRHRSLEARWGARLSNEPNHGSLEMRKCMKRGRPSHATVVAYLALFVALGGGAMAASHLGKNSVGAKQLKKNAVTTAKIKNSAVTGTKINLASLGAVPRADHASSADTAAALAPPEAVHYVGIPGEPLFESGFANYGFEYGATGFYKDRNCRVHLVGVAKGPSGQSAFRLPGPDLPAQRVFEPVAVAGAEEPGLVDISASGAIVPRVETVGPVTIFGLDGVTFRTASC